MAVFAGLIGICFPIAGIVLNIISFLLNSCVATYFSVYFKNKDFTDIKWKYIAPPSIIGTLALWCLFMSFDSCRLCCTSRRGETVVVHKYEKLSTEKI